MRMSESLDVVMIKLLALVDSGVVYDATLNVGLVSEAEAWRKRL
jgi:hypothetical protein